MATLDERIKAAKKRHDDLVAKKERQAQIKTHKDALAKLRGKGSAKK